MAKGLRKKIPVPASGRLNWHLSLLSWVLVWLASLPPYGIPALSAVAFVFPLCALEKAGKRELVLWTPLWTALFELATVWWIIPTIHRFGGIPLPLSAALVFLLCAYLGLFTYAFFMVLKFFTGRYGAKGVCFAPFVWVIFEWLKGRLFGGFSWWGPGYGASMYENLLQNAHIFGVLGLSFLFVMTGSAIALLLIERRKALSLVYALSALFILTAAFVHGASYKKGDLERYPLFRTGLIQPQISQDLKWDEGFREEVMKRLTGLSMEMKSLSLDVLIWPESSVPLEWGQDENFDLRVMEVPRSMEAPLLFGTVFSDEKGIYNGAVLLDEKGSMSGSYKKNHLVPFGEYVPMEKLLFFASPIVESVGNFSPGASLSPIDSHGVKLGANVCYEAIFPGLIREQVNLGAELIVNLSNDAWYEGTPAIRQHFLMDRVRAVENFRFLVRSANGGYSAVIDPHGGIRSIAGPGIPSCCWGDARAINSGSLYGKFGDWWLVAVLLFLAAGALVNRADRVPFS